MPWPTATRVPAEEPPFFLGMRGCVPDHPSEIRTLGQYRSVHRQVGEAGKDPSSAALGFATGDEAFTPSTSAATVAAISHR